VRAIEELSARSAERAHDRAVARRDVHPSRPTLVNVLPPVPLTTSAPDPEPPPVTSAMPPAAEPFGPLPPNPVQRRSAGLALGLVFALMVVTAAGTLGIARAIATRFPTQLSANNPAIFPAVSPPDETSPGEVPSVATLLTALNATPATPGVTIDPALAQRIVDTTWPVREAALAGNDPRRLEPFETGTALQGDTAEIAANACGCNLQPRPLAVRDLFVPRQNTYPAWFVSEVTTNPIAGVPAVVSFLVFTRDSLAAHWMLSLETEYPFAEGRAAWIYATPASMMGGFDLPSPPHNELPADLGAYYEHWADTGLAPPTSPFASGAFTTSIGQAQVKEDETLAAEGEIHRVTYSVDVAQDGDWTVAANNVTSQPTYGWALSCGTVRYEAVTTPAPGAGPILQPADRSTWGATLLPGQYTRITQWGLHETCFLDDLDGIPYLVLGHDGGVIRSAGVLAAVSP
jgi:hypothetical protein